VSELKDVARDLLVLAELVKRVKTADLALRSRYAELGDEGDRTAWKVDGQPVGGVQITAGALRARITDPRALLRWVQANHPTEVVAEPAIRPAYQTALLDAAKEAGMPVDPATGDEVPGIVVELGDPIVRVVPAKGSGVLIEAEWKAGRLALPASVLPELEAPR
jgi:hypothetical protein